MAESYSTPTHSARTRGIPPETCPVVGVDDGIGVWMINLSGETLTEGSPVAFDPESMSITGSGDYLVVAGAPHGSMVLINLAVAP